MHARKSYEFRQKPVIPGAVRKFARVVINNTKLFNLSVGVALAADQMQFLYNYVKAERTFQAKRLAR